MREELVIALEVLRRSPGRSALTMLGLAIGVGAFIAMLSFGRGARGAVLAQFEGLGTRVIHISPRGGVDVRPKPLSDLDVAALDDEIPGITSLIPLASARPVIETAGRRVSSPVLGTTSDYFAFFGRRVVAGGPFDATDMLRRERVCVLGATPAEALFQGRDPLGQRLALGENLACRVVGVFEARGFNSAGRDQDDLVLIPLTTFRAYFGLEGGYFRIYARLASGDHLEVVDAQVEEVLRRTHGLRPGERNDFSVSSPATVVETADRIATILSNLLAAIAAVSLVVGGIGIMNIQLVAVTERTAEIGIRAAVGASPRQILRQFALEAAVLSTVGTVAGAALGVLLSVGVARAMGWSQAVSPGTVVGSMAFGIVTGLAFGYVPAKRAADLDPIEALRRE